MTDRQVEQCLQSTQVYKDRRQRVKSDCVEAIRKCPTLRPASDMFVRNDGTSADLLCLNGTVPIFYKGNKYNIPVSIKFVEDYPLVPPVVYVTPTSDMHIKPNLQHVDLSGLVFLPYLSSWNPSHCNIGALCEILSAVFSEVPPVQAGPPRTRPVQPPPGVRPGEQPPGYSEPKPATNDDDPLAMLQQHLLSELTGRMASEVESFFRQTAEEIDAEKAIEAAAKARKAELDKELRETQEAAAQARKDIGELNAQTVELDNWLAVNSSLGAVTNIDEDAIRNCHKLDIQLLDLIAEDNSIEDAVFVLGRAVDRDIIDCPTYLKTIRKLFREQFMCKALENKVIETQKEMGLR